MISYNTKLQTYLYTLSTYPTVSQLTKQKLATAQKGSKEKGRDLSYSEAPFSLSTYAFMQRNTPEIRH